MRSLASRAGVALVGQVVDIERVGDFVEVKLRVDQAVIGKVGSTFVLREWAGMWPGNEQHLLVGERALFFLHKPGAAGFSSSVDGMEGVVPLIPMGADQSPLLDVRWLATRLVRSPTSPLEPATASAIALADAVALVVAAREPVQARSLPEPVSYPLPAGVLAADTTPLSEPLPGRPIARPIVRPIAGSIEKPLVELIDQPLSPAGALSPVSQRGENDDR